MNRVPVYLHKTCVAEWGPCSGCATLHREQLMMNVIHAARECRDLIENREGGNALAVMFYAIDTFDEFEKESS